MGKVLVHATLSLDGFMAGPNDEMDWMFKYIGPTEVAEQVIKTTGAVVMGRRTYNVANKNDGFEAAYGGLCATLRPYSSCSGHHSQGGRDY